LAEDRRAGGANQTSNRWNFPMTQKQSQQKHAKSAKESVIVFALLNKFSLRKPFCPNYSV
ncbi:MAG: hypothetical protein ABFR33_05970, partial [Verrucomicrobiota bacterium]